MILLEIALATTPSLLSGSNAKAAPSDGIIVSQSRQCLRPGQREQIQNTINNFENKWQKRAGELSQSLQNLNNANARVYQYTFQVQTLEKDLRFLESYEPRNKKEKRQQDSAISRTRQDLMIANGGLTMTQSEVRRLDREIKSIRRVMDGIADQIRIGQNRLKLPDCNLDIPCSGALGRATTGVSCN
mgnify:CR=1 FL=1